MRKQIVSLALSSLFGLGVAIAAPQSQDQQVPPQGQMAPQGNGPQAHHEDPAKQVKRLTKKLNLTSDQQNQILPILSDRQQQMASIRTDSSLAPKDRMAKIRALREDSDGRIRAVLTDNQKQAYDQMEQQMRAHHGQRQQNGSSNPSNS